MRVYRVEAPGNEGAYTWPAWYGPDGDDWEWHDRMCESHWDWRHPSPWEDGMDHVTSWDYRFGFPSMQHLFAWFGGWLQHLLDAGQKVSVYEVEERHVVTGKSGRQVAFNLERATLIK